MLRALALGYEIVGRCAQAFPCAVMMVHPHAAVGALSVALAAELVRAHMRPADLAPLGFDGFAKTTYGVFAGCFGTAAGPSALTAALGHRAIAGGYRELFACCQYVHSAVEARLALSDRLLASGRTLDDVAEIVVETHPRWLTLIAVDPSTVLSAKFSMPYAMAAGGCGGQAAFARDTRDDPAIARPRRVVRLVPYVPIEAWPKDRPGRVTWRLSDGALLTAYTRARPLDNPLGTDPLRDKVGELTRSTFPAMPPSPARRGVSARRT